MNRWKFLLSGATVFGFLCFILTAASASGVRQRSDGCGPHPLIALAAASRPIGNIIICFFFSPALTGLSLSLSLLVSAAPSKLERLGRNISRNYYLCYTRETGRKGTLLSLFVIWHAMFISRSVNCFTTSKIASVVRWLPFMCPNK